MTRDEALRKVASLLKLANSSNANEAALAAQRAQEIMAKFALYSAMLDVDGGSPEPDEPIMDFGRKGAPLHESTRKSGWRVRLASVVAKANGCHIYLTTGFGRSLIQIVGRPADADTVRYLFAYLANETDRLAEREARGCGRTWANNFRIGVVDTIAAKLVEAQQAVNAAARSEAASANNPHALVRVNNAIERVTAKSSAVEVWMKTNMKLGTAKASAARYDGSARAAGQAAGREISVGGRSTGALADRARMLGA
jgi:hypothetical protein